jgi:hypothetical protein
MPAAVASEFHKGRAKADEVKQNFQVSIQCEKIYLLMLLRWQEVQQFKTPRELRAWLESFREPEGQPLTGPIERPELKRICRCIGLTLDERRGRPRGVSKRGK